MLSHFHFPIFSPFPPFPSSLVWPFILSPLFLAIPRQVVVSGSDKKPVLVLSGLVSGTYNFTLTVTNKYDKSSNDTVTLTVLRNPLDPYLIQAQIEGNISNFTEAEKVCRSYFLCISVMSLT